MLEMDSVNYPLTPWQFFFKYFQCTETTFLQIYYKYRLLLVENAVGDERFGRL